MKGDLKGERDKCANYIIVGLHKEYLCRGKLVLLCCEDFSGGLEGPN